MCSTSNIRKSAKLSEVKCQRTSTTYYNEEQLINISGRQQVYKDHQKEAVSGQKYHYFSSLEFPESKLAGVYEKHR